MESDPFTRPSRKDVVFIKRLHQQVFSHDSGGNYHLVAALRKGKRTVIGRNKARTVSIAGYAPWCGLHAEASVVRRGGFGRGGTIYVTGRKSNNNSINTTIPCEVCQGHILAAGINAVVAYKDGELVKYAV